MRAVQQEGNALCQQSLRNQTVLVQAEDSFHRDDRQAGFANSVLQSQTVLLMASGLKIGSSHL